MRSVLLALLALVGCGRSVDMYPVGVGTGGGGGNNGGGGGNVDAPGDGVVGVTINGRVCLINSDARVPTTCAVTGAAGLTVTIGGATATTAADGSFSIVPMSSTDLVWHVTGTPIVASAMQLSYGKTIPAIATTLYTNMVAASQAIAGDGSGAVIARFTLAGVGISGINNVVTTPAAEGQIFYDGINTTQWDVNQTSSHGVVWVPGLLGSSVEISLNGAQNATISNIPVFANTVTFVLAELQ